MEFVQIFLFEVANGEESLDIAAGEAIIREMVVIIIIAGKAYSSALRPHHNWFVKGIFNVS